MAKIHHPAGTDKPTPVANEECRTFMHAWSQFYPTDWTPPVSGWRLSLRCTRCGTERHDLISSRTGGLMGRRYDWPEDYRYKAGEAPTRDELRASMFMRLKAKLAMANAISADDNVTSIKAAKKKAS